MTQFGCNSEYAPLASILLYQPGKGIAGQEEPAAVQHLAPIDHDELTAELDRVIGAYASFSISVNLIPTLQDPSDSSNFNMMFCRDLCFMTPAGAILGSMANETRRGEISHASRALAAAGIPVLLQVHGEGRFEGADALWINRDLVAVGVGNRTNMEAFQQIRSLLASQGVECIALPSTQSKTQHLLGSLQIVDHNLALVREEIIDREACRFLEREGFTIAGIPENREVREKQAMNIVTIAPRKIFMTADCPLTRQLYLDAGLEIAAELPIHQLISGAGGLACATGILARSLL